MTDDSDKREHFRPMALLKLDVLPGEGRESPAGLKLTTVDVAVGGLRCASNIFLGEQTLLRLSLELVGGDLRDPTSVVGDARVLRCTAQWDQPEVRRYDVALEFVQMSSHDRKLLQGYLSSL